MPARSLGADLASASLVMSDAGSVLRTVTVTSWTCFAAAKLFIIPLAGVSPN